MVNNKQRKATIIKDRINWAQKVMYRYTELTNKASKKYHKILTRYNNENKRV